MNRSPNTRIVSFGNAVTALAGCYTPAQAQTGIAKFLAAQIIIL